MMRISFNIIATGLLLTASPHFAQAFQPLVTDDTGTQGKGGNQLEFALNQDRATTAGATTTTRTLPLVYTRGVLDTLDLFVSANNTRISSPTPGASASGSGNASFGAKWRFLDNEASKTSLALRPEIRIPVSAAKEAVGLGTGRTSTGLSLIFTQETGFGAVHANLATGSNRYRDTTANPNATTGRVSVAPVWDLSEQWKLALDVGVETESTNVARTRTRLAELGTIYSPNKDLDFALGVIRRTNNANPERTTNSATLGVTWRFK